MRIIISLQNHFIFKADEIPPAVKITFDDMEVIDGDFVSKNPTIKIALSDESPIPIVDTTAVKIYLNEEPVYYGANPDKLLLIQLIAAIQNLLPSINQILLMVIIF